MMRDQRASRIFYDSQLVKAPQKMSFADSDKPLENI